MPPASRDLLTTTLVLDVQAPRLCSHGWNPLCLHHAFGSHGVFDRGERGESPPFFLPCAPEFPLSAPPRLPALNEARGASSCPPARHAQQSVRSSATSRVSSPRERDSLGMASRKGALVVFGATGFVGSAVAQEGVKRGLDVICLSRKGVAPAAFASATWAKSVQWAAADALRPETYREKLEGADSVVISIGSPPLPFVDRKYQVSASSSI